MNTTQYSGIYDSEQFPHRKVQFLLVGVRTYCGQSRRDNLTLLLGNGIGGLLDGGDLDGELLRDLNVELLLQTHDQLDQVQGVSSKVGDIGVRGGLVGINSELLNDDGLHLLEKLRGGSGHHHGPILLGGSGRLHHVSQGTSNGGDGSQKKAGAEAGSLGGLLDVLLVLHGLGILVVSGGVDRLVAGLSNLPGHGHGHSLHGRADSGGGGSVEGCLRRSGDSGDDSKGDASGDSKSSEHGQLVVRLRGLLVSNGVVLHRGEVGWSKKNKKPRKSIIKPHAFNNTSNHR